MLYAISAIYDTARSSYTYRRVFFGKPKLFLKKTIFFLKNKKKERGERLRSTKITVRPYPAKKDCPSAFVQTVQSFLYHCVFQKMPCSYIACATFLKPAMFAPATRS